MDRSGDEADGAVLPVEQEGWRTWKGLAALAVSIFIHPVRSVPGSERPVRASSSWTIVVSWHAAQS